MRDSFKITFVTPHVGRKDPSSLTEYVRTWQLANLPVNPTVGPVTALAVGDQLGRHQRLRAGPAPGHPAV